MTEPNTWEQPPRLPAGIISIGGRLTREQCDEIGRTWAETYANGSVYVLPLGMQYTEIPPSEWTMRG